MGWLGTATVKTGDWLKEPWHINPFEGAGLGRQTGWIVILVTGLEKVAVCVTSETLNRGWTKYSVVCDLKFC